MSNWIECDSFKKVPPGVWLGTALETDCENKKVLVKIEVEECNNSTFIFVDAQADFERDYLQLVAYCEAPTLFGE